MNKWELVSIPSGKQQTYLNDGWEPFAVVARNESYSYLNTSSNQREVCHRSTDYIYLRRKQQ